MTKTEAYPTQCNQWRITNALALYTCMNDTNWKTANCTYRHGIEQLTNSSPKKQWRLFFLFFIFFCCVDILSSSMSHSLIKFLDVHPFLGDKDKDFQYWLFKQGILFPNHYSPLSKILRSLSIEAFESLFFWGWTKNK